MTSLGAPASEPTPSGKQRGLSPRSRTLATAAGITSLLAGVGFGPRVYRAAMMTERFDPAVVMPTLVPAERYDEGYRLEVVAGNQTVTKTAVDLSPDDWVTGVCFDSQRFPEQLGAFLLSHPTLGLDTRQYYELVAEEGTKFVRFPAFSQPTSRSLIFSDEKGKYEFYESECELRVYACAPQDFPSVNARNQSYLGDWFDSLQGRGRTRSSPRSGIHIVAAALKGQLPPDEMLVEMIPLYPKDYRPYPNDAPWIIITRRRPGD